MNETPEEEEEADFEETGSTLPVKAGVYLCEWLHIRYLDREKYLNYWDGKTWHSGVLDRSHQERIIQIAFAKIQPLLPKNFFRDWRVISCEFISE